MGLLLIMLYFMAREKCTEIVGHPNENKQRLFSQNLLRPGSQSPSLAFGGDLRAGMRGGGYSGKQGKLRSAWVRGWRGQRQVNKKWASYVMAFPGWPWVGSRGNKKGRWQSCTKFRPFCADDRRGHGLALCPDCCKEVGWSCIIMFGLAIVHLYTPPLKIKQFLGLGKCVISQHNWLSVLIMSFMNEMWHISFWLRWRPGSKREREQDLLRLNFRAEDVWKGDRCVCFHVSRCCFRLHIVLGPIWTKLNWLFSKIKIVC